MNKTRKEVCPNCGAQVQRDALVEYNPSTQTYEIVAVLDNATCSKCNFNGVPNVVQLQEDAEYGIPAGEEWDI